MLDQPLFFNRVLTRR